MFLQSFSYLYYTSAKVILDRTTFACLLYCCNFASPTPNFHLIRVVHFFLRVQTDLSRRQHASNKRCALNNECVADNPILRYNITVGVNMFSYCSHSMYHVNILHTLATGLTWSLMVAFIIYYHSLHFFCIVQLLKNMHILCKYNFTRTFTHWLAPCYT